MEKSASICKDNTKQENDGSKNFDSTSPACPSTQNSSCSDNFSTAHSSKTFFVLNPFDRSIMHDHKGQPITVDRMLSTKPLRGELLTRPGPGNKKLLYMSGESITRTLNDVFGFDGWTMEIKNVQNQEQRHDSQKDRWHVGYTAHVRITHTRSGTFKEDVGAGDAIDKSLAMACAHAMKASITDALKRAARHFGDKLGNSLYQGKFNVHSAPVDLQQALDQLEQEQAQTRFGSLQAYNSVQITPPDTQIKGAIFKESEISYTETIKTVPVIRTNRDLLVAKAGVHTSIGQATNVTPLTAEHTNDEFSSDFIFPDMPLDFLLNSCTPPTPTISTNNANSGRPDSSVPSVAAANTRSGPLFSRPQTSSGKRISSDNPTATEHPAKKINCNPYQNNQGVTRL